ncbi:Integrin beta [Oopsacas minuta]|uniref:Integrin beta n=1 Tax=Oopsacas minuta TaxID=111878 RepID=A0AAV7JDB6_9METZ|nr:Integrin beta [Oopsacas minuta]
MKVYLWIFWIGIIWTVNCVAGQESCRIFRTCSECISSTLACGWCDHRPFYLTANGIRPLCDKPEALELAGCPLDKIINPQSETPVALGSTPQLNPSKYEMRLRTQTVKNVTIQVTPQQDFPLDLYILMDISKSMSQFLELAQTAAGDILSTVTNLTSDSRLGFGTFVEKRVRPFVNTNDATHSADAFNNVQPLTTNLTQFQDNIDTVETSNNQDTPEGALDALVQSMVCQSGIEWRGKFDALRMVLLMTDAEFHYALDDKLAGIVTSNDLQCRMADDSNDNKQQFPSYSQIIRTVLEENIVVIFSVDADVRDFYSLVSNLIYSGNKTNAAALLNSQLSALLNLITESYFESSTTVIPVLISRSTHIRSELSLSTCENIQAGSNLVCRNVSYNTSAEYSVELSLDEHVCQLPPDQRTQTVTYAFVGFGQVTIEVDPICSCDCENQRDENSSFCMDRGALVCSVCSCDPSYQVRLLSMVQI